MSKIIHLTDGWYLLKETKEGLEYTKLDESRAYQVKGSENARSTLQNASMHKYFTLVAEQLNSAGLSLQKVVSHFKKADLDWTMIAVKEVIWKNLQKALLKKDSTTKLESDEVTIIYKAMDRYLTTTFGVDSIDFPSQESLRRKQNV
jgi:hypothetical protein